MSKKILVIEDNPVVIQLLETLLREHQFEVTTAADGQEGLQQILTDKPDLIILDVMMPRMTGYQFFKELRAKGDAYKTIPVLITSAKESMKDFFDRWDIVDFLPKPFNAESLILKVDSALGTAESSEAIMQKVAMTSARAENAAKGRKLMVIAVEEFAVDKIRQHFESRQWSVVKALDAKDAVFTAINEKPRIIICQYWEEKEVLDAQDVYKKLRDNLETTAIPFYVFSSTTNSLEAARRFKRTQLIEYENLQDLLQKAEKEFDELLLKQENERKEKERKEKERKSKSENPFKSDT